jgi:hypothetical protein
MLRYISVLNIACTCLWFFLRTIQSIFGRLAKKLHCLNFRNFLLHQANGERWYRVLVCTVGARNLRLCYSSLLQSARRGRCWWAGFRTGRRRYTSFKKTCTLDIIHCTRRFWTSVKRIEDAWWCVRIAWSLNQLASSPQPGTLSTPSQWVGYSLDIRRIMVRFPAMAKGLCLLKSVQTDSVSLSIVTRY